VGEQGVPARVELTDQPVQRGTHERDRQRRDDPHRPLDPGAAVAGRTGSLLVGHTNLGDRTRDLRPG